MLWFVSWWCTWQKQVPWTCFYEKQLQRRLIRRNIYRPTDADATNQNMTHVTTVTIPYIKGTSETISRILQPYNIRVAHKQTTMFRHLLTNVKGRDEPNNRQGAVYKIKYSDCQASYIGDSGTRELTLRCKLKCYFKPMNNPLGVSPSKGKQRTTRGKEKIFWPRWESNPRPLY